MVTELRILKAVDNSKYPPFTISGYYDYSHIDSLATEAMSWTGKAEGVYATVNPVLPDLLARANNHVILRSKHSTTDKEILRRTGLVIDADPQRPAGQTAATASTQGIGSTCPLMTEDWSSGC
jgi:hypothetical protein